MLNVYRMTVKVIEMNERAYLVWLYFFLSLNMIGKKKKREAKIHDDKTVLRDEAEALKKENRTGGGTEGI